MGHSQRDCPLKTAGSDSTKKRVAKVSQPSGKGTGKGLGENSSPEKTTGDAAAAQEVSWFRNCLQDWV